MTSADIDGSALASSIAFTGRLACMSHTEAFDVVRQRGWNAKPGESSAVASAKRVLRRSH